MGKGKAAAAKMAVDSALAASGEVAAAEARVLADRSKAREMDLLPVQDLVYRGLWRCNPRASHLDVLIASATAPRHAAAKDHLSDMQHELSLGIDENFEKSMPPNDSNFLFPPSRRLDRFAPLAPVSETGIVGFDGDKTQLGGVEAATSHMESLRSSGTGPSFYRPRTAYPGEDPDAGVTEPQEFTFSNLRKLWAKMRLQGKGKNTMGLPDKEMLLKLINDQYPSLNEHQAQSLMERVLRELYLRPNKLTVKEKKVQDKLRETIQKVTKRPVAGKRDDDLLLDFAEVVDSVQNHWLSRTSTILDKFAAGRLSKGSIERMVRAYWEMNPSKDPTQNEYADPFKFYFDIIDKAQLQVDQADIETDNERIEEGTGRPKTFKRNGYDFYVNPLTKYPQVIHPIKGGGPGFMKISRVKGPLGFTDAAGAVVSLGSSGRSRVVVRLSRQIPEGTKFAMGNSVLESIYGEPVLPDAQVGTGDHSGKGGRWTVNARPLNRILPIHRVQFVQFPFDILGLDPRDWQVQITGRHLGAKSKIARAIRLALSRCLAQMSPEFEAELDRFNLLVQDRRQRRWKRPGLTGHRSRKRWRKR